MTNLRIPISIVAVGLVLLAACNGTGGDETGDGGGATTTTITLRDNAFDPSAAVVAPGEIELVNDGEAPHTFTIEGQDVDVEVDAGGTATAAIDLEAGTYTLFCRFHREQGMEGTLTVEA